MRRSIGLAALFALISAALATPATAQSNWGNGGWNNNRGGQIIRCESWNFRYARCNADTRDGVRLSRVLAGECSRRNWGTARDYIWVDNGCRAEFEVGRRGGGGLSTGAVIAGAAVAAGLLALLLSKGKKKDADSAAQGGSKPPATINIGPNQVPPAAERAFRQCIDEAARQIGATGGTSLRLTGEVQHRSQGNGWEFRLPLEGTWPSDTHATPAECAATDTAVQKLDFLPEPSNP
jgi:Protein of unknown function (DUF3011)